MTTSLLIALSAWWTLYLADGVRVRTLGPYETLAACEEAKTRMLGAGWLAAGCARVMAQPEGES